MNGRPHLESVEFGESGLVFSFTTDQDARKGGAVLARHQLMVEGSDPEYRDGIGNLRDLALAVLSDVLEDWPTLEVVNPEPPSADEDNEGMGFG